MAAFFPFSQRNPFGASNRQEDAIDPWNLGVSTSTSTAETIGPQSSSEDIRLAKNPPSTPEGLRPRKSIQRIRRDVLGSNHYAHETRFSYNLPPYPDANSRPILPRSSSALPIHRTFSSFRKHEDLGILPSSLQQLDGSPIRSASSFYEQSIEGSSNNYCDDEDMDINSSMEESSIYSRIQAESPDLKRGSKPKTAVGAVLVAMAETSEQRPRQNRTPTANHQSILPSRSWMNKERPDNRYSTNQRASGNDFMREDSNTLPDRNYECDDGNLSSLHASPSSLRRGVFPSAWHDEQEFQKDSSFTRKILNDDPSSSRLEERSIVDHSPYDFNPIMEDEIHNMRRGQFNAPRILSLTNENNKLNISAISNSHNPKDFESLNTSLADTIEDEEDEPREIHRYYHALADESPAHDIISDDAFLMRKVENQRMDKEDLLRSTFERFQDCLDLLKDVYSPSSIENSFFLGLAKTKTATEYCGQLQALLSELQDGASYTTQRQAISFCLSILKNSASFSNNNLNSKHSSSFPTYLSNTRWVPRPGFRNSLGLTEEPLSPQTIRGGDTSLFSLPSENVDTPHTSNVSLATTITTVVSPGKYASSFRNWRQADYFASSKNENLVDMSIQGTRKTINSIAQLLYRLEETCRGLKSKLRGKSMLVESIQNIYFEFLNVSSADLRVIISSFDMEYSEHQSLIRTVSADEDFIFASRSPHTSRSSDKKGETSKKELATSSLKDELRVSIMKSDNDDIDSDNRYQSIECDLWSPMSTEMASLISPEGNEGNEPLTNNGYAELKDEQSVDDLRRTIGSFDGEEGNDEREGPPADEREREPDAESFPATFARRTVGRRPRKSRFWKRRLLALKNRGRQVTAE